MTGLKRRIMDLPGLQHLMTPSSDDDSGNVIALIDGKAQAERNVPQVEAPWVRFADCPEEIPTVEGHDVIADWTA